MLVIGLIAVVGTLCWLVFTFAVYAVPAFVGLTVAGLAHASGSGALGAVVVGLAAAAFTLALFQRLFAASRNAGLRRALALAFAGPAAFAGYHAAVGIAVLGVESAAWAQALGLLGGLMVGASAWSRLTDMAPPAVPDGASRGSVAEI
jgi:hypothetical protein